MKTKFIITVLLSVLVTAAVFGQTNRRPPVIEDVTTPILEPLKLDGPRFGVTYANGYDLNTIREFYNDSALTIDPMVALFGWQFEWQYFQTENGGAGLIELIPMIAGLDQGLFIPSVNMLIGYRTFRGMEVGFGPSINPMGSGMVLGFGYNFTNGYVNFPMNVALVKGKDSLRFSLTFGFNKRSHR
ncbi:MAG: hypothetical protein LAT76_06840 [Schleiferiaceae bacterium]|nr:hypothetical protein [Schleiferiaceae bacterium]